MNTYYSNAPEVVKIANAAFPDYSGRKFKVQAFAGPMRLDSFWDGGSREYHVVLNLATLQTVPIQENGTPFANGGQIMRLSELPLNCAVVTHSIFCGKDMGITIAVGEANLSRMLPAPTELTWEEKVVLSSIRSLKSSYNGIANYRQTKAIEATGIDATAYDAAKLALIGKGMLNKSGAITDAGKNAIGWTDLHSLGKPVNA